LNILLPGQFFLHRRIGGENHVVLIVHPGRLAFRAHDADHLDSRTSVEVMGIFQRLNAEKGITVLLITHEQDIAEYASRIVSFRDGRILGDHAVARRRDADIELASMPAIA
jgi:putative ABC transport system ATP-binding protein